MPNRHDELRHSWEQYENKLSETTSSEELARAKERYEELRGKISSDNPLWEQYQRGFLDWYLFEESGRESAKQWNNDSAFESEAALLQGWRSLFEVEKVRTGELLLRDAVTDLTCETQTEAKESGFSAGTFVEMRLVGLDEKVFIGGAFVFFPIELSAAIKKQMESTKDQDEKRAWVHHTAKSFLQASELHPKRFVRAFETLMESRSA